MNTSRREFISMAAMAALATGCESTLCTVEKKPKIALQLWSIREIFWKNPEKILETLRAAGYEGVEFAGYDNRSAKQIKKLLADTGMIGMGTHVNGADNYTGDGLKKTLDFCAEAGIESCTEPWADFKTSDEWIKFGEMMGRAADEAKKWNIPISFHNHFHEFQKKFNGVTAWDLAYKNASKNFLQQIDACQAINVGVDVVQLLKKYPNRHYSFHAKENIPSPDGVLGKPPTDGGPMVPWREVCDYLRSEPLFRWHVVEAERKPDTLEPALKSIAFLKTVA